MITEQELRPGQRSRLMPLVRKLQEDPKDIESATTLADRMRDHKVARFQGWTLRKLDALTNTFVMRSDTVAVSAQTLGINSSDQTYEESWRHLVLYTPGHLRFLKCSIRLKDHGFSGFTSGFPLMPEIHVENRPSVFYYAHWHNPDSTRTRVGSGCGTYCTMRRPHPPSTNDWTMNQYIGAGKMNEAWEYLAGMWHDIFGPAKMSWQ